MHNASQLPGAEISLNPTYFRGAARIVAASKLSDRERAYIRRETGKPSLPVKQLDAISSANPAQLLAIMKANTAPAQHSSTPSTVRFPQPPESPSPSEISESDPSKTSAISHISPNFASPHSGNFTK